MSEKKYPRCGSSTRASWSSRGIDRQLEDICNGDNDEDRVSECNWASAPYTPAKKPVRLNRHPALVRYCWSYDTYDGNGQCMVSSQGFSARAACLKDAREEIENPLLGPRYGRCSAVIWPPGKIKGQLIRARKVKV